MPLFLSFLVLWLALTSCLAVDFRIRTSPSSDLHLCQVYVEEYSVVLNATSYKSAKGACEAFGMDLADLSRLPHFFTPRRLGNSNDGNSQLHIKSHDGGKTSPLEGLATVGTLLLDCAILGGVAVSAGWISSPDSDPSVNCFAIDFTGTVINGSISSCKDGSLYPVCVKRGGIEKKELTASGGKVKEKRLDPFPLGRQQLPPQPATLSPPSVVVPLAAPIIPAVPAPQLPLPPSLPMPLPTFVPPPTCPPIQPSQLPVCPISVLGFKVVTKPMNYTDAKCACQALGMTLAEPSFLSFFPAAFLTHNCAALNLLGSTAWLDSGPAPLTNGCIAMHSPQLRLTSPRILPKQCTELLPAVCMGAVLSDWNDLGPLFAMIGMDGLGDALRSLYPLPRLPSLSELARMTPLKSGGIDPACSSRRLTVVRVEHGESMDQACGRHRLKAATLDDVAEDGESFERMVKMCPLIPDEGSRVRWTSNDDNDGVCVFIDRSATVYVSQSQLARSLYPPCHTPLTAICK